jgi:acyl phosphate:glycerol-3-phosphate acyltransferase
MESAALALLLAYLLGSLSGSLLLGRLVGTDIRQRGSGNAGGTNAFRTLGWRFALGVVAIDIGKGALAAAVGIWLQHATLAWPPHALAYACVMAAVIGHTWPVFFGFRGGKGAGTLVGGAALLWPACVPWLLGVWLVVLTSTGYVGLATIVAALALLPLAWLTVPGGDARWAFALAASLFILFTHRSNVQRLWTGSEYRFERARVWKRWFGRGAA